MWQLRQGLPHLLLPTEDGGHSGWRLVLLRLYLQGKSQHWPDFIQLGGERHLDGTFQSHMDHVVITEKHKNFGNWRKLFEVIQSYCHQTGLPTYLCTSGAVDVSTEFSPIYVSDVGMIEVSYIGRHGCDMDVMSCRNHTFYGWSHVCSMWQEGAEDSCVRQVSVRHAHRLHGSTTATSSPPLHLPHLCSRQGKTYLDR